MQNDKDIKEKQNSDTNREINDIPDSIKVQWLELEARVKKCRNVRIEACKAEYQAYQEVLEFEHQHGDHTLTLAGDLLDEVKDEVKDIFDQTMTLIRKGKNEETKLILQRIYLHQKNGTPENLTLLHVAVEAGNKEMTRHLIELGSDVEAKTTSGLTPLMLAVKKKYKSIVEILLFTGKCKTNDIDLLKIDSENGGDEFTISYMILNKRMEDYLISSEGQACVQKTIKDLSRLS